MMAKQFNVRPSEIINLDIGSYEAFCFDEACVYILSELQKEEPRKPRFIDEKRENNREVIEWLKANNKKS